MNPAGAADPSQVQGYLEFVSPAVIVLQLRAGDALGPSSMLKAEANDVINTSALSTSLFVRQPSSSCNGPYIKASDQKGVLVSSLVVSAMQGRCDHKGTRLFYWF